MSLAMSATPSSSTSGSPILLATAMTRTFGRTKALAGANLQLREREIHGLIGAGGAGKSTLAKIVAGHDLFDDGQVTYRSFDVRLRNPREALRVGIALVAQDADLVPDLSVLDNIVLPQFGRPGHIDEAGLERQALALLGSFTQADALPLAREVRLLSAAQRQIVQIARALGVRARVILFDEPTAALSRGDADRLYEIMLRLRRSGCAIVIASRRPDDVLAIADRVTVLREGRTVINAWPVTDLDIDTVSRAAAGREQAAFPVRRSPIAAGAPSILAVRQLASPPGCRDMSFTLRAGEILGLGGRVGAGRTAALEAIAGLRRRNEGSVSLAGQAVPSHDPRGALRAGLGHVPADRRGQTLFPGLSVRANLTMAQLGARRGFGHGDAGQADSLAAVLDRVGLAPTDLHDAPVQDLSDAALARIAIARALLAEPKVLLIDDPARGLDPGAREAILALLRDLAGSGLGLVVAAPDDDILALSDRVVVIRDGQAVADVPGSMLDAAALAILSTPRSGIRRGKSLLQALTQDNGGAGFWALIDEDRVICLESVIDDPRADPGFAPGQARRLDDTAIPAALRRRSAGFVRDEDARATMLVPLSSPRGHALGWVGLSLAGTTDLPPPAAVRHRIEMLAGAL
jgi:ribose transport system ATP-binding protein/rhamnose transport system ATP-binding protein